GAPYLLRIVTRPMSIGSEREFTCMRIAAEAGAAPRVWYTNTDGRLSITDFVDEAPLPPADAPVIMARMLRAVHELPAFPAGIAHLDTTCMFLMREGPARDGFFEKIRATTVLSKQELGEFFSWHAELAALYDRLEPDLVSSHNDLFKPDNILFDGERVWLVDWEASFLNDRYADLAVLANLVAPNEPQESIYLREYFGYEPDAYQRARFFLTQQIGHMFYTMAFLLFGGSPETSQKVPEFAEMQRRLWSRETRLIGNARSLYGRVHWERLAGNMRGRRFEEAARIVSCRNRPA
ncbi:MAG TPA: phosphotransferase, partial [Bryobacteraceae bacterium]|nr:phosphotransferase [Bryobacteraceae bacterium]